MKPTVGRKHRELETNRLPAVRQVVVDSCVVSAPSAFLQQAAHLTGGVYLCPARPAGLLQYLLMVRHTCIRVAELPSLRSHHRHEVLARQCAIW